MQLENQESDGTATDTEGAEGDGEIKSPLIPDAGTGDSEGADEDGDDAGDDGEGDDEESGVPDSPEGYELPEIEGLDPEKLKTSPIVDAMRTAAHKAGMSQTAFNEAITDYSEKVQAKMKAETDAEVAALGDNAKTRIATLNATLGKRLPADLAKALAASITTAKGVQAIEKLLATGRKTAGPGAGDPKPMKSREEIERMMADPRYRGRSNERDPAFIAEIDAWWKAQAEEKKGK